MPENSHRTALETRSASEPETMGSTPFATPISFVTESGATVTIMLDPAQAGENPSEALVKAKDAVRCLADAFMRAERRVAVQPDEVGAVFRSWAYRS